MGVFSLLEVTVKWSNMTEQEIVNMKQYFRLYLLFPRRVPHLRIITSITSDTRRAFCLVAPPTKYIQRNYQLV